MHKYLETTQLKKVLKKLGLLEKFLLNLAPQPLKFTFSKPVKVFTKTSKKNNFVMNFLLNFTGPFINPKIWLQ
jgi:hypothetical protein